MWGWGAILQNAAYQLCFCFPNRLRVHGEHLTSQVWVTCSSYVAPTMAPALSGLWWALFPASSPSGLEWGRLPTLFIPEFILCWLRSLDHNAVNSPLHDSVLRHLNWIVSCWDPDRYSPSLYIFTVNWTPNINPTLQLKRQSRTGLNWFPLGQKTGG